jgi:integrase
MNNGEIKVSVNLWQTHGYILRWTDPESGRRRAKAAGTESRAEAAKLAGVLEQELRNGIYQAPNKITWKQFREKYLAEKGPMLSPKTVGSFKSAANHLERVLNPDRLIKLTAAAVSRFQTLLRQEGMGDSTIANVLRHLKAALSWGVGQGLLQAVPKMVMPKSGKAKARAVTMEEFERMVAAVPKVRPNEADAWIFYLRGLYASGLRLQESLSLSWDLESSFAIDLTGRRPCFRIEASAQKSRKDERLPMTEDFYNLLMEVPEAERTGKVFKLSIHDDKQVSKEVGKFGKRAGVVVATVEKRKKVGGKLITTSVKKFASPHDLRRAFATRWSMRVRPATLQRLMRHSNITTTMDYYVSLDADSVGDEVWGRNWENELAGNILGNKRPQVEKTLF